MARFIKALLLCGNIAISSGALAHGGSVDPTSLPVINGHVTPSQFRALSSDPILKSCDALSCTALRSLVSSFDQLRRFYTPNTMARSEDNPPHTVRPHLPVQDIPNTDPAYRAAISSDLVIIARDVPEWSTELLTIEIATLADPSEGTIYRLLAAMPKAPALTGIVKAAHERCEANGEQGCSAIGGTP